MVEKRGSTERQQPSVDGEHVMLWDPMNAWPAGRRWLWVTLAVVVCVLQGPSFIQDLRPPLDRGLDFFQDWASARNRLEGLPIYTRHEVTAQRYMNAQVDMNDPYFVPVNPHPPTSVLLALPLAWLDYPDAFLTWDLVSLMAFGVGLWLVGRELGVRFSAWSAFPVVTLLLLCWPFRSQVDQGQLSLMLVLLVAGDWITYRRGWPVLAGALLAAATAIKLFPGFLFLFFLLRRQWRVLISGAVSFILLTVLTAAVLGWEAYAAYLKEGLPEAADYRSAWGNLSLPGVWFKLFDPLTERRQVEPIWRSPILARAGTLVSCAILVTLLVRFTLRVRSRTDEDRAFGLAVTAMLIVSPLTWEHYLPLLLIPLAMVWINLPPKGATWRHWLFVGLVVSLWTSTDQLADPFLPGLYLKNVATPVHTVTLLSLKCYTLLGLFAFGALAGRRGTLVSAEGLAGQEDKVRPARTDELRPAIGGCESQERTTSGSCSP
jgi:hypothetical protein